MRESRTFNWAVFHIEPMERQIGVPFDRLIAALIDAPIREGGRKVGPYTIDVLEETINGHPVPMFHFDTDQVAESLAALERQQLNSVEELDGVIPGPFDPSVYADHRKAVLRSIKIRRGQSAFRKSLLAAYRGRCAVTGTAIPELLEAAHITPYKGVRSNDVRNGLLLRADVHTLFDLHLLAIDDSLTVRVSNRIRAPEYRRLHGLGLGLPLQLSQRPSVKAVRAHRARFLP